MNTIWVSKRTHHDRPIPADRYFQVRLADESGPNRELWDASCRLSIHYRRKASAYDPRGRGYYILDDPRCDRWPADGVVAGPFKTLKVAKVAYLLATSIHQDIWRDA